LSLVASPDLVLMDKTLDDPKAFQVLHVPRNKHEKRVANETEKFFVILSTEPSLEFLTTDDSKYGRLFYKVLRGTKSRQKINILNNCMLFYCSKTLYRRDGKPYQPNGVVTRLKTIFGEFSRNGIDVSMQHDFECCHNSFTLMLKKFSNATQKKDAKFGCRPTKGVLPDNYDSMIYKAVVEEGKMSFDGTVLKDLQSLFAMKLGTMFGFRGIQVSTSRCLLNNTYMKKCLTKQLCK